MHPALVGVRPHGGLHGRLGRAQLRRPVRVAAARAAPVPGRQHAVRGRALLCARRATVRRRARLRRRQRRDVLRGGNVLLLFVWRARQIYASS